VNSEQYGAAYQGGYKSTVRLLISRGAQEESACDTAQAAWTRGWECIDQLRNREQVNTWVNSIALNLHRRALSRGGREMLLDESTELFASPGMSHTAAIDLSKVLDRCMAEDRALLVRQLHGLTTAEMAREFGVTETAVRLRLMRAKLAARESLTAPRPRPVGHFDLNNAHNPTRSCEDRASGPGSLRNEKTCC
jgi:DNA-directed RNA polymerase specialized sigma24 family protein